MDWELNLELHAFTLHGIPSMDAMGLNPNQVKLGVCSSTSM